MPRIRTVKPEHWSDKELAKLSFQAHLFWIGTWNFSDDDGVFEDDLNLLKSQIFPRRTDIRIEQVTQWIDQLVKARFIVPFTFQGGGYYIHRTFKIHQRIDKPQPSKIPMDVILRTLDECSKNDQPCIVGESKSKVKESKPAEPPPILVEFPFGENFLKFWLEWKNYKKVEHRFSYKSPQSEQSSIQDLVTKSGGVEEKAIAIIQQSMANGWKGFFELKISNNGKTISGNQQKPTTNDLQAAHARRYPVR